MTDTQELLKRLEAGETGREIDAEIAVAVGGWKAARRHPGMLVHPDRPNEVVSGCPAVSTSLDAALALVERVRPDAYIELSGPRKYLNIPTPVPNKWLAKLDDFRGWAATPAAALLAALLKAEE